MSDAETERFFEPLFDKFRCDMLDFVFKLEEFREVFNAECACGVLAITCDIHADETLGLLNANLETPVRDVSNEPPRDSQ